MKEPIDMKTHFTVAHDRRAPRPPVDARSPDARPSIFVTGAASGIGRACAELFARRGWFVGVYDIDADGAATVAATLGQRNAVSGALDVSDPQAWQRAISSFWTSSGGRLDVLLNSAGILTSGRFEDVPLTRHYAMLNVNVRGMVTGCHSAFPYLRETPRSHVVNIASATAIYGQPALATYSSTKFAVRGFTEGLDLEWAEFGIRVSDIWPSFVNTAMADGFNQLHSAKSLGIRLVPADVAATVWACATSRSLFHRTHWTVGLQAGMLALATRLAPSALTRWVVRRIAQ